MSRIIDSGGESVWQDSSGSILTGATKEVVLETANSLTLEVTTYNASNTKYKIFTVKAIKQGAGVRESVYAKSGNLSLAITGVISSGKISLSIQNNELFTLFYNINYLVH